MRTAWSGLEALADSTEEGRVSWTGLEVLNSDLGVEFRTAWLATDILMAPPASIIRVYHLDAEVWVSPYEGEDPRTVRKDYYVIQSSIITEHNFDFLPGVRNGLVLG
jgi:hypothetical protein